MADFLSYSLSDFLLFSPEVYFRLFVLYNQAIWPAQLPALALSAAIVWLLVARPGIAGRLVPLLLGMAWIWIGVTFHQSHYRTINWAAAYFAYGFMAQGALLALVGAAGLLRVRPASAPRSRRFIALGALILAVAALPLIGPAFGRSWAGTELFLLAPDPTAAGTAFVLLLYRGWARLVLFPAPILWLTISALTYAAMDRPEGLVAPFFCAAVLLAVAAANIRSRRAGERD